MKVQLKKWLLLINFNRLKYKKQKALLCFLLFFYFTMPSQTGNYISNGGFEDYWSCTYPNDILLPKFWRTIDSITDGSRYYSTCSGIQNVPIEGGQFQNPKSGQAFIGIFTYCNGGCNLNYNRSYARNRLKEPLQVGKIYCVSFNVNLRNISTCATDAIGACFTDNITLDTIINPNRQLTFLNPQIQNPTGNLITDTMNWVLITGTFVADGSESNIVIGNFKTNAATNTLQVNSGTIYETDLFIDDVSCIPLDLPAYAGPDIWGVPTTTVYLGRPQDVGIDEACMWYKLPNTTNAIDTAAGITITVAATTETYMVKQDICGVIKYDTVVVHASALGISQQQLNEHSVNIFPNPASTQMSIVTSKSMEAIEITIKDISGRIVLSQNLITQDFIANLDLNLVNGVYLVTVKNSNNESTTKKLVISN